MRKLISYLIFFMIVDSFCFGKRNEKPDKIRVMIVDPYIKKSNFPRHVQFDSAQPRMTFSREHRDLQFKKLMLSSYVDRLRMDEVDRDVLYIALRDYPVERVVKKYDQIPPEVLRYAKNNFNP